MNRKKILIVDDDAHIQFLLSKEFADEGYETASAFNGKEAVKILELDKKPNLIIMDIRMPQMNGLETIGNIISKRKNIPVIIYSGYKGYMNDFLALTAEAYILKSPDLSELVNTVKGLT
jgi:CheY-like chemotaxis protein